MSNESCSSSCSSFQHLLKSLQNETVRLALQGDCSVSGKLMDVDPCFVTVAVHRTSGTACGSRVIAVYVPIRRISAIAEL